MDDALLMGGFEGRGDLRGDAERFRQGKRRGLVVIISRRRRLHGRATANPLGERGTGHKLHHQRPHLAGVFEAVNLRDVRMIERREELRFAAEAGEILGIAGDGRQQDLDRDMPAEDRVAALVDLAHAAGADARLDVIGADATTREALGHVAVEQPRRRFEETLRAGVGGQQRLDFAVQRVVATTGVGEVRVARVCRQRTRVREDVLHARPVIRARGHFGGILLPCCQSRVVYFVRRDRTWPRRPLLRGASSLKCFAA
jgi:hypothetical protein